MLNVIDNINSRNIITKDSVLVRCCQYVSQY